MFLDPTQTEPPDVDVIIATHNRPELLHTAVAAVRRQTYVGQINCIVVYDQAQPEWGLPLTEGKRAVTVTTNDRTPGLAGARNTGILSGKSPLVSFCDDDDEWLPDKVEQQVGALTSSDALTSVTGITIMYGDRRVDRVPQLADLTLKQLLRRRVMEAHPSTVMVHRSALLDQIGLVDEQIPGSYAEDYDWIIRAAKSGEFAVVEAPLVRVRWGQSLFSGRWQTIIEAIEYNLDKHPEFYDDPRAVGRLWGQRAFAHASLGHRSEALRAAGATVLRSPLERRAYAATLVALGLISAEWVMDAAHKRGRGI